MAQLVVRLTEESNYISISSNFPSQISFLPRESWAFQAENFTDFFPILSKIHKSIEQK